MDLQDTKKDTKNTNDSLYIKKDNVIKKGNVYFIKSEEITEKVTKKLPILIKSSDKFLLEDIETMSIEVRYNPQLKEYGYRDTDVIQSHSSLQGLKDYVKEICKNPNDKKRTIYTRRFVVCYESTDKAGYNGRGVFIFRRTIFSVPKNLRDAISNKEIELYATIELQDKTIITPQKDTKFLTKITGVSGSHQIISVTPIPNTEYYKIAKMYTSSYEFKIK